MNPDKPISCNEEDAFERLNFSKHLAEILLLEKGEPSIVVGIKGKWGEGKTSCINLIKKSLKEKRPKPIIVDYNPWIISTLDSVIEGFFLELASAIGIQSKSKNAGATAKKVLQFARILTPIKLIPGVEPWGTIVEKVFESIGNSAKAASEFCDISLLARKAELNKNIGKLNREIIVIVDDIDRLPPEQVRTIFQMIKSVSDFKRVAYLVAYDPDPVESSLSYGGIYEGNKYIGKIVQTTYSLPHLSFVHMKDYLNTNVKNLMEKCKLKLSVAENDLFNKMLDQTGLVRVCQTPRDVIRLCNNLRVSAPATENEVSFADLVAWEVLEIKFQKIATIVKNEPEKFIQGFGSDSELYSWNSATAFYHALKEEEKLEKDTLGGILKRVEYSEQEKDAARSILLFLFPKLKGDTYYTPENPENINRIHNRDAFLKLLHCGLASFTFSYKEAERFFKNPEERSQIFASHYDSEDELHIWLNQLRNIAPKLEIADEIGLCELLISFSEGYENNISFLDVIRPLGLLLYDIITSRKNKEISLKIMNRLMTNTRSLHLSETTLLDFFDEYKIWRNGIYFPDKKEDEKPHISSAEIIFSYEELYTFKDTWIGSVRKVAKGKGILESQKNVLSILYRWGQLNNNDYTEPQIYVIQKSIDNNWLKDFLDLFDFGGNAKDLLPFIPKTDFKKFIGRVSEIENNYEGAENIIAFLRNVESKNEEETD